MALGKSVGERWPPGQLPPRGFHVAILCPFRNFQNAAAQARLRRTK
jgi:hypothetical protein